MRRTPSGLLVPLFLAIQVLHPAPGAPASSCAIGEDIFNILFNSTMKEAEEYAIEGAVGFIGGPQDLVAAINEVKGNHSSAELQACLDMFKESPPLPPAVPSPSGDSSLSYVRPEYLGGVQDIPVPLPPSDNLVYGWGYTTYQRPFHASQKFPQFQPSPFLEANSWQDIFQLAYHRAKEGLTAVLNGELQPNYWNN